MSVVARAIAACAILAAFAAGSAFAAPAASIPSAPLTITSAGVTSFGAPRLLTASEFAGVPALANTTHDSGALRLSDGFAASTALSPTLAFDSAHRGNLSGRFASFTNAAQPMLGNGASFLALADAGRYGGLTYAPTSDARVRAGVSAWNGRLDNVSFNAPAATGMAFAIDQSSVTSVLAGVSWNPSEWVSLGLNAVSSYRRNTPLAYGAVSPLGQTARTQAVEVSASFNLGNDWVTTTHFAQGFTQLNQRSGAAGRSFDSQAYSITIAKQGVFGDDVLGFTLSRPASGMIGSFAAFSAADDLPPMMMAAGRNAAPETDLQIGYVTSFLNGRLALQTNAGYQFNAQGQTGTTAVSVLSRAKINF